MKHTLESAERNGRVLSGEPVALHQEVLALRALVLTLQRENAVLRARVAALETRATECERWREQRMEKDRRASRAYRARASSDAASSDASGPSSDAISPRQRGRKVSFDALRLDGRNIKEAKIDSSSRVVASSASAVALRTNSPKQDTRSNAGSSVAALSSKAGSDFDAFWRAYPRHTSKLAAQRKWKQLKPDAALLAKMLAAIARQKTWGPWLDGFIPHPATWLHQGRWDDEEPTGVGRPGDDITRRTVGGIHAWLEEKRTHTEDAR